MSAVLQERPATANDSEELRATMQLTPDAKRELSVNTALALAKEYIVDCPEQAQALANDRTVWAKEIDRIKLMQAESLAPAKKMLEDMKGWAAKWFGPALADREAARELAGQKLLAWDQAEKARLAREAAEREALARRLRQEAEAKAAAEQAKAQAIAAEKRKKEQEALEAQRKAEAEGNARAAREAAARAAKAAEEANAAVENGNAKAQAVQLEAAAQVQAAPVAEVVQIKGQSVKEVWLAELKPGVTAEQAKLLIVEAIAGGRHDLLALLDLDTAPRGALNKLAAALKGSMSVPGFVAKATTSIAGSRK